MKNLIFLFFLFISVYSAQAQKSPVKFGKLNESEITLTEYQNYDAVVLCDYGTYSFNAQLGPLYFYYSRHLRIKILTEEGLKYAQQAIRYYDLKKAEYFKNNRVYELRAQTLNVNSSNKIVKSKVKPKHYSEQEVDADFNNVLQINFPDVKVGSIIEYKINIPTIEIVNPPSWVFQHEIPVLYSELRVISPEYIQYSGKIYNMEYLDVSEKTFQNRTINYSRGSYNYQAYIMQFAKENIPAADSNTPYLDRMRLKIMLDFASQKLTVPGVQYLFRACNREYKYKDRAEKNMTLTNNSFILYKKPNLADLPKKMFKDPYFGPPLTIHMGLNDTILMLTKDTKSSIEKTNIIYDYISGHMQWNGRYRTFVDPALSKLILKVVSKVSSDKANLNKSLSRPFEKQIGTNAEINFILINSLRKAGINAYPLLVSSKENSFLDMEFFNLHQFNHVVALVEIDNNYIVFDAVLTDKGPLIEVNEMNNVGLAIKNNKAFWLNLK
jgi:hypothetical protein